jgi:glycosyltransferase involved in cell wall biosynthesis
MIFFSIIITTFNRENLLPIAIKSVLNQNFIDFELIVIDDASSDNTEFVVQKFQDPRVKYFKNKRNLYKGGARNKGIELAKGNYICFLDDDDYYLSNHLEVFKCEIEKNSTDSNGLYFTMPISRDLSSGKITKWNLQPIDSIHPVAYLFHHKNGVPTPRVCIVAEILKNEKFNPEIRIGQDTELFMRIAAKYPVKPIYEHTVVQVKHEGNSGALKNNTGQMRLEGYRYIFNNSSVNQHIPRSLKYYMISYCYQRMCDHFNHVGDRSLTLRSALWAVYYAPFDRNFKIKSVYILYNLPIFGKIISNSYHCVKGWCECFRNLYR